ncbi:MAG TPA: AI-2E family transporter [Acidimicrobiales bacterium]|nr:AI-2E family transporter [Acidimicrobiales bacterium]
MVGLTGALGVAVAYLLFRVVVDLSQVLLLIGLALFLAVGFDPAVAWLTRRRVPRLGAVVIVVLAILAVVAGFVAAALPPITKEVTTLTRDWPRYRQEIVSGKGWLGQLAVRTHLNTYLASKTSSAPASGGASPLGSNVLGGVLGIGRVVLSVFTSITVVLILTLYFMATLPSVRRLWLRAVPASRRERASAFTDQAFLRVGGYVLGNILTSVVAGAGTAVWCLALGIPYPVLLGLLVAILDLVPVIGSTIGGVVVALVGLTQGLGVGIATAGFYVAYRFLEDHLLNPWVMRRTVHVSAGLSIVASLMGAALLGVVGALIAIPVAATVQLVLDEVTFPSLDRQ